LSSSEDDAVRSAYAALAANAADAERCRAELLDIQDSMKALRAQSVAGIGANNPRRAAARLEKDIHDAEARIASLHREVGARIVGLILGPDRAGRRKDPLSDFVAEFSSDPGTAEIIEEAKACTASISSAERRIQKLEASLRVDALSAELLRLRRTAADHERRIASSKVALQDLGLRIAEAEREIASLSKALGDD
jgi:predicted  nucleic acid-binding Zn-ribbon protein